MSQKKSTVDLSIVATTDGPVTNPEAWVKTSLNIRKELLKRVKIKAILEETSVTEIVTGFLEKYVEKD